MLTPHLLLTPPHSDNLLLYPCFVLGQLFFILKRAGSAVRNASNPIKNRREFLYENWDILLGRAVIAAVCVYMPWRYISLATILGWFNINANTGWLAVLIASGATGGFVAVGAIGYASDSILDGISQSPKLPDWVARWAKENIPNIQVYSSHTTASGVDAAGDRVTVDKTVEVVKTPRP